MKWKTLAVLALMALAGCGGDDDNDNAADNGGAAAPAETTAGEPTDATVEGKLTDAKFIKAAGLKAKGDHYVWSDGCEVAAVATDKASVKKLQKAAKNPTSVIPNKSATVAIEIVEHTYPCAVHASLVLRGIP